MKGLVLLGWRYSRNHTAISRANSWHATKFTCTEGHKDNETHEIRRNHEKRLAGRVELWVHNEVDPRSSRSVAWMQVHGHLRCRYINHRCIADINIDEQHKQNSGYQDGQQFQLKWDIQLLMSYISRLPSCRVSSGDNFEELETKYLLSAASRPTTIWDYEKEKYLNAHFNIGWWHFRFRHILFTTTEHTSASFAKWFTRKPKKKRVSHDRSL